jgi:hypothetical protein
MTKPLILFFCLLGWLPMQGQDSLYTNSDKPAAIKTDQAMTVGLVFRSKIEGLITHVRVYKSTATNEGTFVVGVWTSAGQQLWSQPYEATGPAGWRNVKLNEPVRIQPNTDYLATVWFPMGKYGYRTNMFTADRVRGNLTAPASARAGGNNRYIYGSAHLFPNKTYYQNSSYYVDVVFSPRKPLIVNAGRDTLYEMPKDTIRMKGVVSGDLTWFSWNMVDSLTVPYHTGTTVIMKNSATLEPYLIGFREGRYVFSLTGWDMYGSESRSLVTITVAADPKSVFIELLRDGTWRVKDDSKLFLMKTGQ